MTGRRVMLFGGMVALVALGSVPVRGQAGTSASSTKQPTSPRTPWGDPDLRGIWRGYTRVPMERPLDVNGREFLTDAEIAAKRKAQAALQERKRTGDSYEFAFRSQANYNNIFAYEEELGPIARRTSEIVDPPDGRLPSLTAAGLRRWEGIEAMTHGRGEADSYIDRSLGERCINTFNLGRVDNWGLGSSTQPGPRTETVVVGADPAGFRESDSARPTRWIFQVPGYVAVVSSFAESVSNDGPEEYRIFPLDGRAPLPSTIRQFMGDSRAHWEGDTLVIATANFNDPDPMMTTYGSSRYPGTRDTLRVVERYTRVDADNLEYRYTIEDPETYSRPYTGLQELARDDTHVPVPALCHENNKDLSMQLSAARADEAANADFGAESARLRQERLAEVKAEMAAKPKTR